MITGDGYCFDRDDDDDRDSKLECMRFCQYALDVAEVILPLQHQKATMTVTIFI